MKCPKCGNETEKNICPFCGHEVIQVKELKEKIMKRIDKAIEKKYTWTNKEKMEFAKMINRKKEYETDLLKSILKTVLLSKEAFKIVETLKHSETNEFGKNISPNVFTLPESHMNPMSYKEIDDYVENLLKPFLEKFDEAKRKLKNEN